MKGLLVAVALGACCVLSVSSANIPSGDVEKNLEASSVERSGGWGAQEAFSGPPAVVFALPIAIGLIIILWIAAYNTLRSPPPKIGFGAGAQGTGAGGWGQANYGWGLGSTAAGGWGAQGGDASGGWAAAGSQVYPEYADVQGGGETVAAASSPAQAATVAAAVEQTVAAGGSRSFGDLTHRVLRSVEHQY